MICLLNTEKRKKRRKSFQFWLLLFYGLAFLSVQFVFNMEQGLPLWPEWLFFNRVNARARKGAQIGPALCLLRYGVYFYFFLSVSRPVK